MMHMLQKVPAHEHEVASLTRRMAKAARWMDQAESDGVYQAAREEWSYCRSRLEDLRHGR
jgi:hypothetical protein